MARAVSEAEEADAPAIEPYAATTQSGHDGDVAPFFFALAPLASGSLPGAPPGAPATGTAETGPCDVVFEDASTSSRR